MEFRQETEVGAVSVPNIVTCSSPWGQPGDPVKALDCSSSARSWGSNRSTTSRRVKVWVASGQLGRTPGSDGRSVFTARTPDVVIPTISPPVRSAAQGEHPVIGIVQHAGSTKLRTPAGRRRLSDIRRRLRLPGYIRGERAHASYALIRELDLRDPGR